jgi:formylglycine-generating enzyme
MSGNVREWCWDWYGDLETNVTDPKGSQSGFGRVWKGGGWMGAASAASRLSGAAWQPMAQVPIRVFACVATCNPAGDEHSGETL